MYDECRKALEQNGEIRCAMDHILEAERKGEINHDNVLYIVENINVAGKIHNSPSSLELVLKKKMLFLIKKTDWVYCIQVENARFFQSKYSNFTSC
jgi:hypothetical protein